MSTKTARFALVLAVIVAVFTMLGAFFAVRADATPQPRPKVTTGHVQRQIHCIPGTSTISYEFGQFNNYENVVCDVLSRHGKRNQAYADTYVTTHDQDLDQFGYEGFPELGFSQFWLVRCDGWSVFLLNGDGGRWTARFVKLHPGCTRVLMDGATSARKGLPG